MKIRFRFLGTLVVIAAALGVVACGKKVDECNAVIDAYNKGAGTIQSLKEDDPQLPGKLAGAYTTTATDLGKLEITTPELKTISGKMQSAATAAAAVATEGDSAANKIGPAIQAFNSTVKELQTFCGVDEKK